MHDMEVTGVNDVEVRCPHCRCFLVYFFHTAGRQSMRVLCPRCRMHILIETVGGGATVKAFSQIAHVAANAYTRE